MACPFVPQKKRIRKTNAAPTAPFNFQHSTWNRSSIRSSKKVNLKNEPNAEIDLQSSTIRLIRVIRVLRFPEKK
jgi:hypothetical protein